MPTGSDADDGDADGVGVATGPTPAGNVSGIGSPYFLMIRLVVSPSVVASTGRRSVSGRSTMLNVAEPTACRWAISSATGSVARMM